MFSLFIRMLLWAHYEDNFTSIRFAGKQRYLKRGEFSGTVKEIAENANLTHRTCRNILEKLVEDKRIELETDHHLTVVRICNYSKYQDIKSNVPTTVTVSKKKSQQDVKQPELLNDESGQTTSQTAGQTNSQTDILLKPIKQIKPNDIDKSISSTKSSDDVEKNWKFDENDRRLAELLFNLIKENGHFPDKELQDKNIDTIRLMRTSDKRKPEEIEYMIIWSQQDSFWNGVILSTEGLRRNYNKMATQIMRNNKSNRIVEI